MNGKAYLLAVALSLNLVIAACSPSSSGAADGKPLEKKCLIEQPKSKENEANFLVIFHEVISIENVHFQWNKCDRPVENLYFSQSAIDKLFRLRRKKENSDYFVFIVDAKYNKIELGKENGNEILLIDSIESLKKYSQKDFISDLYGLR